jgi:hypothetical protein
VSIVLASALLFVAVALAQSPGTSAAKGNMKTPRYGHSATIVLNGTVLTAGGFKTVTRPPPVLLSTVGSQGAVLHASTHQVVSPANPALAGQALEIYALNLIDGAMIPPRIAISGH